MARRSHTAGVAAAFVVSLAVACSGSRPVVPEPAAPPRARAAPAFKPLSLAILEDYDKGDDLRDVERDFALMRQLGIRTWRGSLGWDDYEPARGAYDFEWLHRFAEKAADHGIALRPYLGYTPGWAAAGGSDEQAWNDPPARVEDWERFAAAIAGTLRRHRNVLSLEIYNEQNVPLWWDGSRQRYAEVLRRGSAAIRREKPGLPVLLGGLVFPDVEWIEEVCGAQGAAASFDVLPLHAYPETWTPPEVTVENYLGVGFASFLASADESCGARPIWINEAGFATTSGRSEREQAAWWVRAVASWLAEPRVEHIGVYEIKDLPAGKAVIGEAANHHLGITRADRAPKLAFATVQRLASLLEGDRIAVLDRDLGVVPEPASAEAFAHAFLRADGDQVVFAWTRRGQVTLRLTLPIAGSEATEYGLDGAPTTLETFDGRTLAGLRLVPGTPRLFRVAR